MRLFGVEEELLLVDEVTGFVLPAARELISRHDRESESRIRPEAELTAEMQQEMIEAVSQPHASLSEIARAIAEGREVADAAARRAGARAVALATAPLPAHPHATSKPRYQRMMQRYGVLAHESLACGMHVHVGIESAAEGVAILDRVRAWLPLLRALSANSPYSQGSDTGHASYRTVAWNQWPSSGPIDVLKSPENYAEFEQRMLQTGVLLDEGMLYFDARLSRNHPTVEVRVADVCLWQEDAVTVAGLVRGLVETAARDWRAGVHPVPVASSVIRLASWKAALTGVSDDLVHPVTGLPVGAAEAVDALLRHVATSLDADGDLDAVATGAREILGRGNGAQWQRAEVSASGLISRMVTASVAATAAPRAYRDTTRVPSVTRSRSGSDGRIRS